MKPLLLLATLLLGCTTAHAGTPATLPSETLVFSVAWGPLKVGTATLSTQTTGHIYTIRAEVSDTTSLITLKDSWQTTGTIGQKGLIPTLHTTTQVENTYKSDKSLRFTTLPRTATFRNNLNPADTYPPQPWPTGTADILTTLTTLRTAGRAVIMQGGQQPTFGTKRPFTLVWSKPTLSTINHKKAWEISMRSIQPGKKSKGTWKVWLADDATLTPLQIEATLPFATLTATLQSPH